ncbi:hypothetical protein [Pengzhenrongella frigida]|uniref:Uncharacterized protein n=1 Tax=Pengzhenrongella frigida TaxID=1259133 RepID=A0A4Q5MUY7_9MICO|nr:hypothetical protein [Cellulomonas sp. HLT2-17]RYV49376.1 hypothetical protein EUA98_19120 [Cellulomonas sp. HLT2-17]
MLYSPTRSRLVRAALVGVTVVLLVGVVGLAISTFGQPDTPAPAPAEEPTSSAAPVDTTRPASAAARSRGALAPVVPSCDPVDFATSAARALFEWDTTVPVALAQYKGRLLVVADPSGQESAGLALDLASYLPSPPAWEHLREYDTRQWLEVTGALVPDAWTDAIGRDPNLVASGTFAVTITGIRHRAGTWDGEPVTDQFDVALTAFVGCEPTYPTCSLLRLTQLDKPLR